MWPLRFALSIAFVPGCLLNKRRRWRYQGIWSQSPSVLTHSYSDGHLPGNLKGWIWQIDSFLPCAVKSGPVTHPMTSFDNAFGFDCLKLTQIRTTKFTPLTRSPLTIWTELLLCKAEGKHQTTPLPSACQSPSSGMYSCSINTLKTSLSVSIHPRTGHLFICKRIRRVVLLLG